MPPLAIMLYHAVAALLFTATGVGASDGGGLTVWRLLEQRAWWRAAHEAGLGAPGARRRRLKEPEVGDECHRASMLDNCGTFGCNFTAYREHGEGGVGCQTVLGGSCGAFDDTGDKEAYEVFCLRCVVEKQAALRAANCTGPEEADFCKKDPDVGVCGVCQTDDECSPKIGGLMAGIFVCDKKGAGDHPEDRPQDAQCGPGLRIGLAPTYGSSQ